MASFIPYIELGLESTRLLLILIAIFVCLEIIIKSSGKMRRAGLFFMVAFIPSIFYAIGRILNIESISENGKMINLTWNLLTTLFLLLGLTDIHNLIKEIIGEVPKKEKDVTITPKNKKMSSQEDSFSRKKKKKQKMIILR